METDQLCRFCSYLPDKAWPNSRRLIAKGRSLTDILKSSTQCSRCLQLSTIFRNLECEIHDLGNEASVELDVHMTTSPILTKSEPDFAYATHSRNWSEIFSSPWQDTTAPLGPRRRRARQLPVPDQKTPKSIYNDMQACFETCLVTHQTCRKDTNPDWLPTRLLDVEEMRLRLSTDITRGSGHRYVALSHEWGKQPFLTLTLENLEKMSVGNLELWELRKTFQDAIETTRRLGMRYLWIDSLCIIQGLKQGSQDQSEWHREASSMDSVYRNAIVTLAASSAVCISSGLFQDVPYIKSVPLNYLQGLPAHECSSILFSANPERPLDRRAWVMQEYLLSPRTIHFGAPFAWECREMVVKWVGDNEILTMPSHLSIFPSNPSSKIWTAGLEARDEEARLSLWNEIVMNYSDCLLSEPSDKLVAIGGLARIFAKVMQTEYLAGLWSRHLLQGMLWETATSSSTRVRYRAPSWSWASVDGRIKFQSMPKSFAPMLKIKNCAVEPLVEIDNFGQIKAGFIEAEGCLVPLGEFRGVDTNILLYRDEHIRVSIDDYPSTDYGRLYLLPLLKSNKDDFYWSLLVRQRLTSRPRQIPEYQRLGIVTVSTEGGLRTDPQNSNKRKTQVSVFFPIRMDPNGNTGDCGFTKEDFENGDSRTLRLL